MGNDDYWCLLGRYIYNLVEVGCISLRLTAFQNLNGHVHGVCGESSGILEDSHALLSVDDVLYGSFLSVLAGNVIVGHMYVCCENVCDGTGGTIVGSQNEYFSLVCFFSNCEVSFSLGLGYVEVPVGGYLPMMAASCSLVSSEYPGSSVPVRSS